MAVWIGMMVPVDDTKRMQPIVIQFDAGIWDRKHGLLPFLGGLECSSNASSVTIIVAESKESALTEMNRRIAALNRRVSIHMAKFNEFMRDAKPGDDHEDEEDEPCEKPKVYRVTPDRIEEVDNAMKEADGVAKVAAKILNIPGSTLHYYLKRTELRHWRTMKGERAEHSARVLHVLQ